MKWQNQIEKELKEQKVSFNNYLFLWMRGCAVLIVLIVICEILSFFVGYLRIGTWVIELFLLFIVIRGMIINKKEVEKVRVKLKELENAK